MSTEIDFTDEIHRLHTLLAQAKQDLAALEQRAQQHDITTRETRQALDDLRRTLQGELPRSEPRPKTGNIRALTTNPDTGRPARGSRRNQIETICRKLGRGGQHFRTAEVLNVLREVEHDISTGMKSYTYAVMTALEKDNIIEKVDRGTWKLIN